MTLQTAAFNRRSTDSLIQLLIVVAVNTTGPNFTLLRLCISFAKVNASFAGRKGTEFGS